MNNSIRCLLALLALLLSTAAVANTLVSIVVTPVSPTLHIEVPLQFTATGIYDDSSVQDLTTSVIWSSSNPGVATISNAAGSKGLATGRSGGSSTITASSGVVSGNTSATVSTAVLANVAVSPVNATIAQAETLQFQAQGTFSDATTVDLTGTAIWTTGDSGVATVSNAAGSQGLATGVAPGMTTITASFGIISGSTTINVTPLLFSLQVDDGEAYASYGKLIEYTVTLHYGSGVAPVTTAVAGILSAGFDIGQAHWQCISVASVACAQQGAGELADSVTLSPGESAIWQVTVPVLPGTNADTVEFDVTAAHTPTASDIDVLTVFRDGFE